MGKENVLMFVDIRETIVALFAHYCLNNLSFPLADKTSTKQAITAFSDFIQNYLIDNYNLDSNIEEEMHD